MNSLSTKNSNQFWGFWLLLLKFSLVEEQPASTAYSYYQRKIYGITGRICNIQKFEIGYFYLAIRTNYSQEWSTKPTTITVTKSGSTHNNILTHSSGKTTLLVQMASSTNFQDDVRKWFTEISPDERAAALGFYADNTIVALLSSASSSTETTNNCLSSRTADKLGDKLGKFACAPWIF